MANPRIDVEIGAKVSQFQKAIADSESSLNKFGRSATKIGKGLSLAITAPILAIGTAAVKTASDFEEISSKFETVFRDISKSADEAFKDLRNNFGLSSRASKELLGNTGDLLTGFGFSQKAALDLSREVNKLAVDLASFTNFSGGAKGASDALTKALLGERESVKSLGISILEEDVKKQVAINTAKGLTFETERQAKAYATLDLAIQQSGNAIGDYERTKLSLANQTRLLQARIEDLSNSFGEILIPTATKIVVGINNIVKGFLSLDESTRKIIIVISGLAAAIGPLSLAIGGIISALPLIASGFAVLASPIALLVGAVAGLSAGIIFLNNNVEFSGGALKKYEKSLDTFEKALTSVSDAQKVLNDFNNTSLEKTPEFIQATKDKIKAKIDEARATLLQAQAERQLAVEEAEKLTTYDIMTLALLGFTGQQERVNKVQEEGAEKYAEINRLLNELTVSYIKLGSETEGALDPTVEKLGLIESLTKRISEANEKRIKATDITEIIQLTKLIKLLEKELSLLNALAERASEPVKSEVGVLGPRDNPFAGGLPTPVITQGVQTGPTDQMKAAIAAGKKAIAAYYAEIKDYATQFSGDLQQTLTNSITNTFADLGASIGEAIATGANVFEAAGKSILRSLGNFLGELGYMMIEYGTMAIVKSKLDASLLVPGAGAVTGPLAIAAGVALVALSSAIGAKASGRGGGGGGGGVGAGVSGTSFQGQGAIAFNGNREIFGELVVRGNDLVYVFDQSRDKIAKG